MEAYRFGISVRHSLMPAAAAQENNPNIGLMESGHMQLSLHVMSSHRVWSGCRMITDNAVR